MAWPSVFPDDSTVAHGVLRSTLRKLLESRKEPNRFGLHEKLLMTNILQKCRVFVCEASQDATEEKEDEHCDSDFVEESLNSTNSSLLHADSPEDSVVRVSEPLPEPVPDPPVTLCPPRPPSRKRKSAECDDLTDQPSEKICAFEDQIAPPATPLAPLVSADCECDSSNSSDFSSVLPSIESCDESGDDLCNGGDVSVEPAFSPEYDSRTSESRVSSPQVVTLSSVSNLVQSFSKLSPPSSSCGANQVYLVPYTTNANGDLIIHSSPMQVVCFNLAPSNGLNMDSSGLQWTPVSPNCQPMRITAPPSA